MAERGRALGVRMFSPATAVQSIVASWRGRSSIGQN
jgi:hypothetical protein